MKIRIGPSRSFGYLTWSPIVINFGYLQYNKWWWHNLQATSALVFRVVNGEWPTYYYWDKKNKAERKRYKK